MKFSYAIDSERRLIFLRYTGHFTLASLLAGTRRLWADPAYSRSYRGLVDLSDESVSVNVADLHALIDFIREQPSVSEARWAAVTASPLATACGLLYQRAIASRHAFEVFSSFEAAASFLRLEGAPPPLRDCPLD
jgi:hypothetical protein